METLPPELQADLKEVREQLPTLAGQPPDVEPSSSPALYALRLQPYISAKAIRVADLAIEAFGSHWEDSLATNCDPEIFRARRDHSDCSLEALRGSGDAFKEMCAGIVLDYLQDLGALLFDYMVFHMSPRNKFTDGQDDLRIQFLEVREARDGVEFLFESKEELDQAYLDVLLHEVKESAGLWESEFEDLGTIRLAEEGECAWRDVETILNLGDFACTCTMVKENSESIDDW